MTALVFVVIVVAWLAYLVPWFTNQHRDDTVELADPAAEFGEAIASDSVTLVRRSADWDVRDPELDVSTPFTRAAALREIRQSAHLATVRRRRLMVGLVLVTVLVRALTPVLRVLPWWSAVVPASMLVASVFVCRFSVRTLDASLARRREQIRAAWENETITLALPEASEAGATDDDVEYSVELSAPIEMTGSLWDPIPVIQPSYVTKPLVPRTVRTIDLSAPAPSIAVPPTAESPVSEVEATSQDAARPRRAVGE